MKVYIVIGSDFDDFTWVHGVYASLPDAQAVAHNMSQVNMDEYYEVEKWEVQ